MSYRRINNIQSAQKRRPSEREQQQPSLLGIGPHGRARQNGNAHAQCDAPLERCRVIHDSNDIQFIKRQTVILEEIQCFLLGAGSADDGCDAGSPGEANPCAR